MGNHELRCTSCSPSPPLLKIQYSPWKMVLGKTILTFLLGSNKRPIFRFSSWWFQPLWKIWVKMGSSSPNKGENKKYLSCHLVFVQVSGSRVPILIILILIPVAGLLLGLLKDVTHPRGANTHEELNELRGWGPRLKRREERKPLPGCPRNLVNG